MNNFNAMEMTFEGGAVTVRPLASADRAALLAFARGFATHDLLFLRRDVARAEEVERWISDDAAGRVNTLVATRASELLGVAVIVPGEALWSPHVGELLILVSPASRGRGLGRQLMQQAFRLAMSLDLEKIIAQMTTDQVGAIQLFESLGFKAEALLRDHVKDRDGSKHDLVILSHDVGRIAAQQDAYGLTDASTRA